MATTFNPNTADFSKELVREASEAIFTEAYRNAAVADIHEIYEDVKVNKQIVFVGGLTTMLGKGSNDCNSDVSNNAIPMSQKVWAPADISDRLSFCWKALEDTFWAYILKTGVDKADVSETEFMVFIGERIEEALLEMIYRIAHFNNTAADNVSGGGVITNGVDLDFFNKIDGLWTQIYAAVATNPDRLTSGLDGRNGGASYAAQKFDATDTTNMVVTETLDNMTYEADERLMGRSNVIITTTKSVGDQYKRELKKANRAFTTERIENGIEQLIVDGLEVRIFSLWDRIIKANMNDGSSLFLPHRALMTVKENIPLGTADSGSFNDYDVFYDKTDKLTYVDIATTLDCKLLEEHLFQVAY